jgi:hypothetical protein
VFYDFPMRRHDRNANAASRTAAEPTPKREVGGRVASDAGDRLTVSRGRLVIPQTGEVVTDATVRMLRSALRR